MYKVLFTDEIKIQLLDTTAHPMKEWEIIWNMKHNQMDFVVVGFYLSNWFMQLWGGGIMIA